MKHLQHVRGKWIVRVTVPEELREIIGKRELVEYDLPADKKARERRAVAVVNSFYATIEEAREVLLSRRPTLSTAAKEHYRAELEADDRGRVARSTATADSERYSRTIYANKLRLLVAGAMEQAEAEALIGYAADDLKAKGRTPDLPRSLLLRSLAQVQLEALSRFEERDDGKVMLSDPKLPLLTEPDPEPKVMVSGTSATGTTLSDVLAAFHKERTARGRSLATKTMDEHKTAIRMFEQFVGYSVPVKAVTRRMVLDYKQALLDTPTRYTLRFPGLTLPQAIKANAKRDEPYETLDPQTINMKWLSHLSSILQWAMKNGHIEVNPARDVRVDVGSAKHKEATRHPFERSELLRIFGHEMFADPKNYATRQWAVLMALYTGARASNEFSAIKLNEIYQEQGVWVFNMRLASKNRRSKRLVPIHKDLIALGLFDYVKRLREAGEVRLFPDWEPADKVNRWFLRTFLPKLKIDADGKVFHSFRHNLKTELVRTGCPKDVHDMITGHGDQSVAAVYVHDMPLKRMNDALNRVSFDLPIPGLKRPEDETSS